MLSVCDITEKNIGKVSCCVVAYVNVKTIEIKIPDNNINIFALYIWYTIAQRTIFFVKLFYTLVNVYNSGMITIMCVALGKLGTNQ